MITKMMLNISSPLITRRANYSSNVIPKLQPFQYQSKPFIWGAAVLLLGATTIEKKSECSDADHELRKTTVSKIQLLEAKKISSYDQELKRLKQNPHIENMIEKVIEKRHILGTKEKVILGQIIELQQSLKDEYYVISHGKPNRGIILDITAKKTLEIFESKKNEYFATLRHPCFLKKELGNRDVFWYKKQLDNDKSEIIDHQFRNELLCGDINLINTTPGESALHFFFNKSVAEIYIPTFWEDSLEKMIFHYFPNKVFAKKIAHELFSYTKDLKGGSYDNRLGGTLYAICVPKNSFSSIGYISKSVGRPKKQIYTSQQLDAMQEGIVEKDEETSINCRIDLNTPQVRLLTSKMSPENNVFIISYSTLSAKEVQALEASIETVLLSAKKQWEEENWADRPWKSILSVLETL